jgi:3-hydroxymyristoyl/3-hydroxydecanoyl-(acyl carrier protein) dehydratase
MAPSFALSIACSNWNRACAVSANTACAATNRFSKATFPVEAAAQLAGVVAQCDPSIAPLAGLKLTALRNVKILGTARPGEVIEIRAQIDGRMGGLIQATAEVSTNGAKAVSAELTLAGVTPSR